MASTGVFLITYFNPLRMLAKLPIDVGNLVVSGTKITMEKPHLSGFTRDERAYELSADAAKQDLTKPDLIELQQYPRQGADAGQKHDGNVGGHRHL